MQDLLNDSVARTVIRGQALPSQEKVMSTTELPPPKPLSSRDSDEGVPHSIQLAWLQVLYYISHRVVMKLQFFSLFFIRFFMSRVAFFFFCFPL